MVEPSGFHDEASNLGNEILRKSLAHSGPTVQREAVMFEERTSPSTLDLRQTLHCHWFEQAQWPFFGHCYE